MSTASISDLTIGQCEMFFLNVVASTPGAAAAGNNPVTLGNITAAEIAPDVTYVEHFKSVKGNRRKDKTVAITKSINIPFTFDECSTSNLKKFFLANTNTSATRAIMMRENYIEGRAILNFQTNVGNNFVYVIPNCMLRPEGGLAFTSEDWMSGNFSLEVLYHDTFTCIMGSPNATAAPYGYLAFDRTAIGSPFTV